MKFTKTETVILNYKRTYPWLRTMEDTDIPQYQRVEIGDAYCITCKKVFRLKSDNLRKHSMGKTHIELTERNQSVDTLNSFIQTTKDDNLLYLYTHCISLGIPYYLIPKLYNSKILGILTRIKSLPSERTYKRKFNICFDDIKCQMASYIEKSNFYSLIIDETSDPELRYYLNILLYNGKETILLKTVVSYEPYNAVKMSAEIINTIYKFRLDKYKLLSIMADNARVNDKAVENVSLNISHPILRMRCISHITHLCIKIIKNTFTSTNKLIANLNMFFTFRRSSKKKTEFRKKYKYSIDGLSVIQTRWGSWQKAVGFLLGHWDDILEYAQDKDDGTNIANDITTHMESPDIEKEVRAVNLIFNWMSRFIVETEKEKIYTNKIQFFKDLVRFPIFVETLKSKSKLIELYGIVDKAILDKLSKVGHEISSKQYMEWLDTHFLYAKSYLYLFTKDDEYSILVKIKESNRLDLLLEKENIRNNKRSLDQLPNLKTIY